MSQLPYLLQVHIEEWPLTLIHTRFDGVCKFFVEHSNQELWLLFAKDGSDGTHRFLSFLLRPDHGVHLGLQTVYQSL